ncbi:hypothetical protein Q3G72_016405 [Acer saccharum]|nr:hypothetical protein Q3G72_016405 [Acer saccharum]
MEEVTSAMEVASASFLFQLRQRWRRRLRWMELDLFRSALMLVVFIIETHRRCSSSMLIGRCCSSIDARRRRQWLLPLGLMKMKLKLGTDRQIRLLLALLFLVSETTSFVLDQIGGNQLGYLLASFILSVIGFLSTAYSVSKSRSERENDRNVIELVFSMVQLIMTYVYFSLAYMKIKFNSNIASIFPLVLAITALALPYKQNEPASPVTPNDEDGELENSNVAPSDRLPVPNQSPTAVNGEETATTPDQMEVERGVLENNDVPSNNSSGVTRLPVPNQSPTAVNGKETATTMVPEENQEKSRASHISSGTTDTSGEEVIRDSKAPTKPATSSEIELFSKLITTTDLEKQQIVPNGAEEHFQIPEGQESVDLLVKDTKREIGNSV